MAISSSNEQIKKITGSYDNRQFAFLIAKPLRINNGQKKSQPVLYIGGHNLRPKKDDDVIKASYDIQKLADALSCDVYSIIYSSQRSYHTAYAKDYPEGVAITQLHQSRAVDMLAALKKLQSEGKIQYAPRDIIGFSDGGILALALVYEEPKAFRFVMIGNTPGLDAHGTGKKYVDALLESVHVGRSFVSKMMSSKKDRLRLSFKGEKKSSLSVRESINRQFAEKHAVARTQIQQLVPQILAKNKNLILQIVTTDNDALALPEQVKQTIEAVTPPAMRSRIQFTKTGWEIHTMGYFASLRDKKLHDLGILMREMREQ